MEGIKQMEITVQPRVQILKNNRDESTHYWFHGCLGILGRLAEVLILVVLKMHLAIVVVAVVAVPA